MAAIQIAIMGSSEDVDLFLENIDDLTQIDHVVDAEFCINAYDEEIRGIQIIIGIGDHSFPDIDSIVFPLSIVDVGQSYYSSISQCPDFKQEVNKILLDAINYYVLGDKAALETQV